MKLVVMAGAGNTFAVLDARTQALPEDLPELARRLCAEAWAGKPPTLDGVLVVLAGEEGSACRMVIYNADGSRPEACGNGLRCVAKFAREQGFCDGDRFRIDTDAGAREVELLREGGAIVGATARMGAPRKVERKVALATSKGRKQATLVDMGNPHAVLFVADERKAPVHELGRELEYHPRFPHRTNVEFATLRDGRIHLRVWERGVGETLACGTGACATAVAAVLEARASAPVEIEVLGGRLKVDWDGTGDVILAGPCENLWSGDVSLRENER